MEINKGYNISQNDIETLARIMLPKIQKFYATEGGRKYFDEWKAEQKKVNSDKNKVKP